ncbi:ATP-dependent DNA ligase [Candidatus Acetothermia bacterium]|nr:ATP-dependent DNA ligase [Candidatus Acetothermia bacterium]MBI3643203.1 ATP-dependent DNA ligase [Candidatus Acetothermia bacterium]
MKNQNASDQDLKFSDLVDVFERLDATRSGNEMIEILSGFFARVPIAVIDITSYFIQGNVVAEHEDVNLNIGERLMAEAIARASGKSREEIDQLHVERGDFGLVAELVIKNSTISGEPLTVRRVHDQLLEIAHAGGSGSQEAKLNILANLLNLATPVEAKYVVRIALGVLRLGAGTMTLLNALAVTFTQDKRNKKYLERAYNLGGDVGLIARTVATSGIAGLSQMTIQVGHPIKMMAAQRVQKLNELFERMPHGLAAEFKYDGERLQCHKRGEHVSIYSRNLENITAQYPDIVDRIRNFIRAKEAIVEGEAVALVPGTTDQFQVFQVLMRRKRKHEIEKYVEEIPVKLFLFDVLFVDGENMMEKSYPERRKILEKLVSKSELIEPASAFISDNPEEIEAFFLESLEKGFEGIMAKSCAPDSIYRAGAREWSWIKWKREYESDLVDTFDVVVIGGIAGRGKRSGTWGALLCAVYNPELDRFESLCKVSTGFNDEDLGKLPEMFKTAEISHVSPRVYSKMEPTRWFEPRVVLEISGAELTKSPIHTCGMGDDESSPGLALRFPRFLRFRDDKDAEQATSAKEVVALYKKK